MNEASEIKSKAQVIGFIGRAFAVEVYIGSDAGETYRMSFIVVAARDFDATMMVDERLSHSQRTRLIEIKTRPWGDFIPDREITYCGIERVEG
jgi:hypothetical protein